MVGIIATGCFGPPVFWYAVGKGIPVTFAAFLFAVAVCSMAWHISAWMVRGKNW